MLGLLTSTTRAEHRIPPPGNFRIFYAYNHIRHHLTPNFNTYTTQINIISISTKKLFKSPKQTFAPPISPQAMIPPTHLNLPQDKFKSSAQFRTTGQFNLFLALLCQLEFGHQVGGLKDIFILKVIYGLDRHPLSHL